MTATTRLDPAGARLLAAFPFHLVLDRKLRVARLGDGLARACPGLARGRAIAGHLAFDVPDAPTTWKALAARCGQPFGLRTAGGLALRGRLVSLVRGQSAAFVGVPDADAATLAAHGIDEADLAPFGPGAGQFAAVTAERDDAIRQVKELRAAAEAHAEQRKARGTFLAGLAREIRTAVNGNVGVLRLLADSGLDRSQADLVHTATRSSHGVLAMLEDVVDYSSLQFSDFASEVVPYDLHRLFAHAVERARPEARERGLELVLEIAPDVPQWASGPARRVQQVLRKLLDNALRFTERGAVSVRLSLASDYGIGFGIRAEVRDTGVGIAREHQPRLFQEFSRLESAARHGEAGSGLGLAICQRILKNMDGLIGVDSIPGKGSTFWFVVHQGAPDASEIAVLPAHPAPAPFVAAHESVHAVRVLVAEDSPVNQKVATRTLERLGCEWVVAHDGREAVERFAEECFDLVLMDCLMPVMDGYEAARQIHELAQAESRTVAILALTANDTPEDRRRASQAGMAGFITKPLRPEVLQKAMSHFLGRRLELAA